MCECARACERLLTRGNTQRTGSTYYPRSAVSRRRRWPRPRRRQRQSRAPGLGLGTSCAGGRRGGLWKGARWRAEMRRVAVRSRQLPACEASPSPGRSSAARGPCPLGLAGGGGGRAVASTRAWGREAGRYHCPTACSFSHRDTHRPSDHISLNSGQCRQSLVAGLHGWVEYPPVLAPEKASEEHPTSGEGVIRDCRTWGGATLTRACWLRASALPRRSGRLGRSPGWCQH